MTELEEFLQARDFLLAHREDYDTAYQNFHWPRLKHFNWALDYFDFIAKGNNNIALWLVDEDTRETKISFSELSLLSNRIANYLRALGVKRGDTILLMLGNILPLWEVMLAAIKLGAIVIPTSLLLVADDLADRIERGKVKYVIAETNVTSKFANLSGDYTKISIGNNVEGWLPLENGYQASDEFIPDGITKVTDPLLWYFTSGTTTKPKLVEHTHQSYPIGHLSTMYWLGLIPGDVHWNISSPGWGKHAWSNFFTPWNAGATVFVYHYLRFNAKAVLNILEKYGITTLCAPPTVWRMLIQEDLTNYSVKVRELVSAGEPLNPEIIAKVNKAWNIVIRDGYGQTETTAQLGNTPGKLVKWGSVGRPLPGYNIKLLDANNKEVAEGEIGFNVDLAPLGFMSGYKDSVERTKEVTRQGFYHTGDVARRDEDGYYTYVGRADELFKASDYLISPFELESILITHEAVAEAAVVPSPDSLRSAIPKAFVVLRGGYVPSLNLAKDIMQHVRKHVSPFKRIRRLEFYDLPKTISGKIRRVELREIESKRSFNMEPRRELEFWEDD